MTVKYVHLRPGSSPPALTSKQFLAVLVIDERVDEGWREMISRWLVDEGCLFMMAWGTDCSLWHDSVDRANLDIFPEGDIPMDRFVMTTCHGYETLQQAFQFARRSAFHPKVRFMRPVLVDICREERSAALQALFRRAKKIMG